MKPQLPERMRVLTRITMPTANGPQPFMVSPGLEGLVYREANCVYITWIKRTSGDKGVGGRWLRALQRSGRRIVILEVLHKRFGNHLQTKLGFWPERLRLKVYPIIPELVEALGEDLEDVRKNGTWCDCMVWEPGHGA